MLIQIMLKHHWRVVHVSAGMFNSWGGGSVEDQNDQSACSTFQLKRAQLSKDMFSLILAEVLNMFGHVGFDLEHMCFFLLQC